LRQIWWKFGISTKFTIHSAIFIAWTSIGIEGNYYSSRRWFNKLCDKVGGIELRQ
jgi:hypothetical protein